MRARNTVVAVVACALVVTSFVAGATTYGLFQDSETAGVSVSAATDTGYEGRIQPAAIRADHCANGGDCGRVTVFVRVWGTLNASSLALQVEGETIQPVRANCEGDGDWDCRLKFDRGALLSAVNRDPGTYDPVLTGQWEDGDTFEATLSFRVRPANGTATATPTSTSTDTPDS